MELNWNVGDGELVNVVGVNELNDPLLYNLDEQLSVVLYWNDYLYYSIIMS